MTTWILKLQRIYTQNKWWTNLSPWKQTVKLNNPQLIYLHFYSIFLWTMSILSKILIPLLKDGLDRREKSHHGVKQINNTTQLYILDGTSTGRMISPLPESWISLSKMESKHISLWYTPNNIRVFVTREEPWSMSLRLRLCVIQIYAIHPDYQIQFISIFNSFGVLVAETLVINISDVDECTTTPCFNNGKCSNNRGGYTCQCTEGFRGNRCQEGQSILRHPRCINIISHSFRALKNECDWKLWKTQSNTF